MLISNPDIINSCRVCQSANQDGDYVCIYDDSNPPAIINIAPSLSESGQLYENLFAKVTPETYEYYPRYICNSCDLQIKLFKKLKDKALRTIKYLEQLYDEDLLAAKEELKIFIDNEEGECLEDEQITVEQSLDTAADQIGQIKNEIVLAPVYIVPSISEEANSASESTKMNLQNQFSGNTELSVVEDLQEMEIPGIDKSDYVMEIYKVLDDGTKSVASDSVLTNEVDLNNFDIEETSQCDFIDGQYVNIDPLVIDEKLEYDHDSSSNHPINNKTDVTIGYNIKIYTCTECDEKFTTAKEFKHHKTYIHIQTYNCKICSKTSKSARMLAMHMKTHSDTPAFQCNICQRTFTQKVHLQYHMNRHNNVRNFKCDLCDKSFLAKGDLKIHMRVHTGNRPYVCEICGKGYMLLEHLKTHALTHTGQKFSCSLCSLNFATPKTLRQHVNTIHAPEPRFKCKYCAKTFRRKHHLQYHMNLHPIDPNDSENISSINNFDDLEVYSPADVEDADEQMGDDPDDYIKDSGFVVLSNEAMLV